LSHRQLKLSKHIYPATKSNEKLLRFVMWINNYHERLEDAIGENGYFRNTLADFFVGVFLQIAEILLVFYQAMLYRIMNELGIAGHLHFFKNSRSVCTDRFGAYAQAPGYAGKRRSSCEHYHY
jgi:hypothetical protein